MTENRWVKGPGFTYTDLITNEVGSSLTGDYDAPSVFFLWGVLIANCLFYGVLTWYFDHVVSSNRGRDESFFFCFSLKYLNCCKKKARPIQYGEF